jgi:cbb3-type cytochrome oxidase maturation protein
LLALGFLLAFIKAVKTGQFDDNYTPSIRILLEDTPTNTKPTQPASINPTKQKAQ